MKKLLLAVALALLPFAAQAQWIRIENGWQYIQLPNPVAAGGGTITGGTCTNQVVTAIDTAGLPTCATVVNGMIGASTIDLTTKVTGLLPLANFANGSALSLLGRSANSSGVQASITAGAASDCVFRESGSTVGCGTVATAGIADSAVTLAKMANMASNRVLLGSGTAGSGAAPTAIAAGNNVTVYQHPATGNRLGFDPRTQWFLYDDFLGVPTGITNPGGQLQWTVTTSGTPANFSKLAGNTATVGTSHPGILVLTGNAGNTAQQTFRTDIGAFSLIGGEVAECMIWLTSTGANGATGGSANTGSTGSFGCGFGDTASAVNTATDGALLVASSGDTHWQARNRRAGSGNLAVSNLSITYDTWHRLTVYVESVTGSGNGSIHYYVDGTELNVSPIITNVPDADNQTGLIFGAIQSTGTAGAVALMYVDYVMAYGGGLVR